MAFVQAVSIASSANVNILITPAIITTPGNFVAVGNATVFNAGNNVTVADSYNNVWTGHTSNPFTVTSFGNTNDVAYCWWAKNITGGTGHTFTCTNVLAWNQSIVASEFSGRALDFPVVAQSAGQAFDGTPTHATNTVTTPLSGCDLWSFNFTSSTLSQNFNTGGIWYIPPNASNPNGASYQPSFAQITNNIAAGRWYNTFTSDTSAVGGLTFAIKPPSYTIIQQLQNSTSTGATATQVPNSSTVAVTTGNTLIYVAKYSSSAPQSVIITDTLNNTWNQIFPYFDGSNNTGFTFGYAKNIVGGQTQISMSLGGVTANFLALYVVEVSGLSQSNPFTTGEFVVNKVVAPGNGADGVASQFTGNIARRPALLLGFCMDATNSSGQALSAGTNFNALNNVWTFGLSQTAALAEHQRI